MSTRLAEALIRRLFGVFVVLITPAVGSAHQQAGAGDRAIIVVRTVDALLRRLPITLLDDSSTLDRAWALARRYDNHPLHDMLYVALAHQHGQRLFTADQALLRRLVLLEFVVGPPR